MSNIVIPINFSANSRNTIQYGMQLAKKMNLNLELMYVIRVVNTGYGQINPVETIVQPANLEQQKLAAEEEFKKLLKELEFSKPDNVEIIHFIRTGFFADIVATESNKESTKLLLLTGRSKDEKIAGGFYEASDVISKGLACPVIVVSTGTEYKELDRILYATDFQEEDIDSLKNLSQFAKIFNAAIYALHITDNDDFNKKIKQEGFSKMVSKKVGYPNIQVNNMPNEKVTEGIVEYAHKMDIDMIALLKENEGFWKRIFSKSTTEKLIKETDLPIMAFIQ